MTIDLNSAKRVQQSLIVGGLINAALMFALILLILVVVMLIFATAGRLEHHLLRWN